MILRHADIFGAPLPVAAEPATLLYAWHAGIGNQMSDMVGANHALPAGGSLGRVATRLGPAISFTGGFLVSANRGPQFAGGDFAIMVTARWTTTATGCLVATPSGVLQPGIDLIANAANVGGTSVAFRVGGIAQASLSGVNDGAWRSILAYRSNGRAVIQARNLETGVVAISSGVPDGSSASPSGSLVFGRRVDGNNIWTGDMLAAALWQGSMSDQRARDVMFDPLFFAAPVPRVWPSPSAPPSGNRRRRIITQGAC